MQVGVILAGFPREVSLLLSPLQAFHCIPRCPWESNILKSGGIMATITCHKWFPG
uniref:Uncharacterized protein n=1 Tax=Rhizophora mucronata TaxID=61149 RepID=A0A2P2NA27_RHIMU